MTATLRRPAKPGQRRRGEPVSQLVQCPEDGCDVITGTLDQTGEKGFRIELSPFAAGAQDGARCTLHSRTEAERADESERALNIALLRKAGPYLFGLGGWVAVDDIAQGAE